MLILGMDGLSLILSYPTSGRDNRAYYYYGLFGTSEKVIGIGTQSCRFHQNLAVPFNFAGLVKFDCYNECLNQDRFCLCTVRLQFSLNLRKYDHKEI